MERKREDRERERGGEGGVSYSLKSCTSQPFNHDGAHTHPPLRSGIHGSGWVVVE